MSSSRKAPLLASGIGLQISGKKSLATGVWRLEERSEIEQRGQSSSIFMRLCAWRLLCHSQLTTIEPAIHPEVAIQPSWAYHVDGPKRHDPPDFPNLQCSHL